MTRRETDTSAFEPPTDQPLEGQPAERIASTDPDALFDELVAADVLAVDEDGAVRTTEAFDDTHAVYHDSFVGVSDREFREAVAAAFGLADADAAADRLDGRAVSRAEFVCYLAVRSHLGETPAGRAESPAGAHSTADLAAMAEMVSAVAGESPVPPELPDVTDDPAGFLAGRDRAVVSAWKRFCDPCESAKTDLDALLDAVPDGVAVAGVDGEVATDFCATHGVESAPGFVLVTGADRRTVCTGDLDDVAAAVRSTFET